MKSTMLIPLFLAPLAAAAVIESRQSTLNSMLSGVVASMPGADGVVTDAKAQLRPDATRRIIRYGPFTLPPNQDTDAPKMEGGHSHGSGGGGMSMGGATPAALPKSEGGAPPTNPKSGGGQASATLGLLTGKPMDPNGVGMVKRLSTGMCKDCTVLAGKTTVVYANGTKAELSNGVYLQ
jgi:hypothetical protein